MILTYNQFDMKGNELDSYEYQRDVCLQDVKDYFKQEFNSYFRELWYQEEKEDIAIAMICLLYNNEYLEELVEDERFISFMEYKYLEQAETEANSFDYGYEEDEVHLELR